MNDPRVMELLDLAADLGGLPYSVDFILCQEDAGHLVDLETGAIILNGSRRRAAPPAEEYPHEEEE